MYEAEEVLHNLDIDERQRQNKRTSGVIRGLRIAIIAKYYSKSIVERLEQVVTVFTGSFFYF